MQKYSSMSGVGAPRITGCVHPLQKTAREAFFAMFQGHRRVAKEGDLAIIYERKDSIVPVILKSGEKYQSIFGAFLHDSMIGKEYGSVVRFPSISLTSRLLPNREISTYIS